MPDHARLGLDIWGDDEWLDLPPDAQHLYFVLKTWPPSFCGAGEWHPARIAARAKGWTADDVCASGQTLMDGLFLLVDLTTQEYLLRSWIKHDGLYKIPNMAVSMANARAAVASRQLRGVVVYEVRKLHAANRELGSWQRDQVATMLKQNPLDPAAGEWPQICPNPPDNPRVNPPDNPRVNPSVNPSDNPSPNGKPNPSANPRATPSPTPNSNSQSGYVSTEGHQTTTNGTTTHPPSPYCEKHPGGTKLACRDCQDARLARDDYDTAAAKRKQQHIDTGRQTIHACPECDHNGMAEDDNGDSYRCTKHPTLEEVIANA